MKKKNAAGADVKNRPADGGRLGFLAGEIEVPDDFDSMGAREIEELFVGEAGADGGEANEPR